MSLKRRIQKLERNIPREDQETLILQWDTPGPLVELINGDRVWRRRNGEDEESFIDRALGVAGQVLYLWGTTGNIDGGLCSV